jgi:hypothetical protein
MSLPSIILDDLTWQDTVDAVRREIAAVSAEEWTLHAPVDPGVTLVELLAYLLEQRVYWLDQVSDPLVLALVAMLGEEPRGARPALTLMEFTNSAAGIANVAAGAAVERRERLATYHFRTRSATAIAPVERITVATPYGTREASRAGRPPWGLKPVSLMRADGAASEFAIEFLVRGGGPGTATEPATVFLELNAPGGIAPEWTYGAAADVQAPAALEFRYSVAGGGRSAFGAGALRDGTQGLRRSGVVAFDMPADWAPSGVVQNGLTPYTVWCSTARATFASPPRLTAIAPNVAQAAHEAARTLEAEDAQAQVGRWLRLPGMKLQLAEPEPPLEESIRLRIRERDGEWHEWKATFDLARHGPGDRVFLVDRPRRRLVFGDGLTGRIPVPDRTAERALEVEYLGGGGEGGNLGARLVWTVPGLAEVSAINPAPARGGAETETAEEVRARAAAALQTPERAVTADDFEKLTESTPGVAVARAHAAIGLHPDFPCTVTPGAVTVWVVPAVPRGAEATGEQWVPAPKPDPGMVAEVLRRLDARRLITTEVFVRGPVYRRVTVAVRLAGDPATDATLRRRIEQALTRYLDPLTGGDDGRGWPFGNPLRPSEIAGRVERVLGEEAVLEYVLLRLDGDGPSSDCADIAIGPHELVWLESLAVEWRADSGKRGGLR